jgi:hypothetical protein
MFRLPSLTPGFDELAVKEIVGSAADGCESYVDYDRD